jgi:DNA-binding CsgD family transcriptional regulator
VTSVQVMARSPVVRAGLESMLRESGVLLGGAESEVILTDADPPAEGRPVVWLSDDAALTGDVRGLLPRSASEQEILAAVEAAAAGLLVIHPRFQETLTARPVVELEERLTPRELEVLRLLAEGVGNKEIAYRLGISEHTVKFHVASLLDKLHASSRTEAVSIGIRAGLVML